MNKFFHELFGLAIGWTIGKKINPNGDIKVNTHIEMSVNQNGKLEKNLIVKVLISPPPEVKYIDLSFQVLKTGEIVETQNFKLKKDE